MIPIHVMFSEIFKYIRDAPNIGSGDTAISLFPLIIYQRQSQNPKRSNELTKAKCELWLTSQNLQFHFSTESPASLCVTSQS